MAFINKIGVSNYKAFKHPTELDLSLINILVGTNGSGKSTITSVIKLLNCIDFKSRTVQLHKLGTNNLKKFKPWNESTDKQIEILLFERVVIDKAFKFYAEITNEGKVLIKVISEGELIYREIDDENIINKYDHGEEHDKYHSIEVNLDWIRNNYGGLLQEAVNHKPVQEKPFLEREDDDFIPGAVNKRLGLKNYSHKMFLNGLHKLLIENDVKNVQWEGALDDFIDYSRTDLRSVKTITYSWEKWFNKTEKNATPYLDLECVKSLSFGLFKEGNEDFENTAVRELFIDKMSKENATVLHKSYLCLIGYFLKEIIFNSVKEYSKLVKLVYTSSNIDTGNKELISKNDQDSLLYDAVVKFHSKRWLNSSPQKRVIIEFFKLFNIGEDFRVTIKEDGNYQIEICKYNNWVKMNELGFGYRQIIKLLIIINALAYENETRETPSDVIQKSFIVILEEPETNLHPDFQSKLADLLVKLVRTYCIQFVIETHSEYLIRKLQYFVAKRDPNQMLEPKHLSIHYFTNHKGTCTARKIKIHNNGNLSPKFGKGFYDEATTLQLDLHDLQNISKN